jgi:hypothetical protein
LEAGKDLNFEPNLKNEFARLFEKINKFGSRNKLKSNVVPEKVSQFSIHISKYQTVT